MSEYKKTRGLYVPDSDNPFKISRSKLELFVECPRCFYLDRRLGISRPPGFPFPLNSAVDHLLKNEFDSYRNEGKQHPIQVEYGVDAKPVKHCDLENWRNNFTGIKYLHVPTNLLVFGAIDDLWINNRGEYIVVDYKSTSIHEKIVALDKPHHATYKRQIEIYQWLLKNNNYKVSDTSYFVYANAFKDRDRFDKKLDFDLTLISYIGNSDWVEGIVFNSYECLNSESIPELNKHCDYCSYLKNSLLD